MTPTPQRYQPNVAAATVVSFDTQTNVGQATVSPNTTEIPSQPALQSTQPQATVMAEPVLAANEIIYPFNAKTLKLSFLIGFSSIFLINAMNALVKPADFIKLLEANPISRSIGHYGVMTKIIFFNDLLIGMLILVGWKKKYVWAWAGIWLLIVAGIKAFYLF